MTKINRLGNEIKSMQKKEKRREVENQCERLKKESNPKQFFDFAMHPRWSLTSLFAGRPQMANFDMDGFDFDRTESRAKADWNTLKKLRDNWPGKLDVKGDLDAEDAVQLAAAGVDAVQVSSHGARQLESAPSPINALKDIRQAVGPDFPLFFDTGLRGGEDVTKAYALGANFTFFGRVLQFAIAAGGEEGLHQLWSVLRSETSITLAQIGCTSLLPSHLQESLR